MAEALLQQQFPNDDEVSLNAIINISNIPDDVLLEIFDSYRQTFQDEYFYERAWNSNKGWFKLAHVCREWRRVVFASPRRLHVRLLFTKNRPGRSKAIINLPPLPRAVDIDSPYDLWSTTTWYRLTAALDFPDRVCRIAITLPSRQPWPVRYRKMALAAMNQPFPALESLELDCRHIEMRESYPQLPFLSAETPHLRRLKVVGRTSTPLSDILSRATSVVDLTLDINSIFEPTLGTHFLAHLQDMPFLRSLELKLWSSVLDRGEKRDVLLSKLKSFSFSGSLTQLEAFTAGLAAPSLMELRIAGTLALSPAIHLSRFIQTGANQFFSAQLQFNTSRGGVNLFMRTHSHSDESHDPPFQIFATAIPSADSMGHMFSTPLSTVQDVFALSLRLKDLTPRARSSWCTFFKLFHNAKILRVAHGMESDIGDIFQSDDEPSALQLFPALEEIELNATMSPDTPNQIDEERLASVLGLFRPFVDARQQAGRPVNVHWNTDRMLPKYHCYEDSRAFRTFL